MTNSIISLERATNERVTAAGIEAIADWHDEKAERAERPQDYERHDLTSFRLRKLANQIRCARA